MEWEKIDEHTFRYNEGGVCFFLLIGTEKALLIDTGMQVRSAKELAEELTNLPILLFNTHTDIDHIGSNDEFEEVMMNPAELVNYKKMHTSQTIIPVFDGDIIDLGERPLLAIALPGHTPGSTALLDRNNGWLFSGDPIQDDNIFMFGEMRNLPAYIHSLKRLEKYKSDIKKIFPCHGTCPVDYTIVPELIRGAINIENQEIIPTSTELFGNEINVYDVGVAKILCN